jgi:uncharacterized protein (TIGR02611 family)
MERAKRRGKKAFIAIIGGLVVLVGLVLIPYPGPGWLIVFGGLAILATEFEFAARLLHYAKGKYDAWVSWLKRQNVFVKILTIAATGIVVILTIWIINGFGLANSVFSLNQEWLVSPLFR